MRRNWLTTLLFALALAVQAIAPAVAHVASQTGASSAIKEVCFKSAAPIEPAQTPGHLKSRHDLCLFCQSYCDGVAPLAARAIHFVAAPVCWTALAWTEADRSLASLSRDYSRQARAPPANF